MPTELRDCAEDSKILERASDLEIPSCARRAHHLRRERISVRRAVFAGGTRAASGGDSRRLLARAVRFAANRAFLRRPHKGRNRGVVPGISKHWAMRGADFRARLKTCVGETCRPASINTAFA